MGSAKVVISLESGGIFHGRFKVQPQFVYAKLVHVKKLREEDGLWYVDVSL